MGLRRRNGLGVERGKILSHEGRTFCPGDGLEPGNYKCCSGEVPLTRESKLAD